MNLQDLPVRRAISEFNSLLVESWCLKCGVFIAASKDVRKLQAAEAIHACLVEDLSNGLGSFPAKGDHISK